MTSLDYSLVDNIRLVNTGLLYDENKGLMDFLILNKLYTVGSLIKAMDNNSFKVTSKSIISEARGLADLFKYKYFNISFIIDLYINSVVKEQVFDIYGEKYRIYGVRGANNRKETIYFVISRLGFSDREKDIILNRNIKDIDGRILIDILIDVYNELSLENVLTGEERVFRNKLFLIINHYKKKRTNFNSNSVYNDKMKELERLLTLKSQIEKDIDAIRLEINSMSSEREKNNNGR